VSGNRVQRGIRETIRRSTGIIPRSSVPRDPLVRQRSRLFDGLFSPFGAHREVQNFANLRDDSHRVLFVLRVRLFADAEQRERLRGLFFGKWNVLRSVFDKEREEKEEKYRIRIRDELLLLSFSTSRKAKREKRDPKIESSDPRETSKTARNCLSKEIYIERERALRKVTEKTNKTTIHSHAPASASPRQSRPRRRARSSTSPGDRIFPRTTLRTL